MASTVSVTDLFDRALIQIWDHDPGTAAATIVTPNGGTTKRMVAMTNYEGFAAIAMASTLTGAGITKMELVCSEDSAGATNLTVIKDSGTVAADAVGDYVVLETSADEIQSQLATAMFVGVRLTLADAADEAVVTYIRHRPAFAARALTANVIA